MGHPHLVKNRREVTLNLIIEPAAESDCFRCLSKASSQRIVKRVGVLVYPLGSIKKSLMRCHYSAESIKLVNHQKVGSMLL